VPPPVEGQQHEANEECGTSTSSSAPPAPPPTRQLDPLEVAKTVDQATKAKEELARQSIHRARDEVLAQRAALKAQMEEQERRLREEEQHLVRLEHELRTGVNQDERSRIEALRAQIETRGREVGALEREVSTRREAMRRATDAYVEAEERLAERREARRRLEEEMLDLILSTGRAKDARLTGLLLQVPEVSGPGCNGSVDKAKPDPPAAVTPGPPADSASVHATQEGAASNAGR